MLVKSQNGWPAASDRSVINIQTFTVPVRSGTVKIPLRAEAAPRLIEMIKWWDANVEPVATSGPNAGTWGYAYRTIRGYTTTLSNHASGTAIDINAPAHPLGARNTIPADKVGPMRAKAAELGLRWGGDYRGRADEMHFEIITPPPAEAVAYSEQRSRASPSSRQKSRNSPSPLRRAQRVRSSAAGARNWRGRCAGTGGSRRWASRARRLRCGGSCSARRRRRCLPRRRTRAVVARCVGD